MGYILAGLIFIVVAAYAIKRGIGSVLKHRGPRNPDVKYPGEWRRDDNPHLFWACVVVYFAIGLAMIAVPFIRGHYHK
jgi:hypothetical protein